MSLPNRVDDAMADIALVFHWSPAVMDVMTIEELADWRERARIRHEIKSGSHR